MDTLADQIYNRVTVLIEASARHVHLTQEQVEALFGVGHRLTPKKELSQPGQFACEERVTVVGPKSKIARVSVLGPPRKEGQVELSRSDVVALGLKAPVRLSGDLEGTPSVTLENEGRSVTLPRGLIVAKRHMHMSTKDAELFSLKNGEEVHLRTLTERPVEFYALSVRVDDNFETAVHLDFDEANGCGYRAGDRGLIL